MTPPSLHLNFKQRVCVCVWHVMIGRGMISFVHPSSFPWEKQNHFEIWGGVKGDKVVQYFVHLIKGYVFFFFGGRKILHQLGWWKRKLGQFWSLQVDSANSSRYCPAGWPLSLPPCHAPPNDGPVFSVVDTWLYANIWVTQYFHIQHQVLSRRMRW